MKHRKPDRESNGKITMAPDPKAAAAPKPAENVKIEDPSEEESKISSLPVLLDEEEKTALNQESA